MKNVRVSSIHRLSSMLHPTAWLLILGLASLVCHSYVAHLSREFVVGTGHTERPIITVLILLGVAHVLYLAALAVAGSDQPSPGGLRRSARPALWTILVFAGLFRIIHLPGNPIQEIDIYRYLWDGQVTRAGLNPYAHSPLEAWSLAGGVVTEHGEWLRDLPPRGETGARLAELLRQGAIEDILLHVQYAEVPTAYPPASQATFALAALLTPSGAGVRGRVIVMKLLLTLFDVGCILVLLALLRAVGKSPCWCLAYAWCPLVIKEVANSGHLDAQAVFFTLLAALFLAKGFRYAGAVAWAVAILSKTYPLILLPLIVRQLWTGRGPDLKSVPRWRAVIGPLALAAGLVASAYFAVWPERAGQEHGAEPLRGLRVFLTEWETNDLLLHSLYQGIDRAWDAESQQAFVETFGAWWPRQVTSDLPPLSPPLAKGGKGGPPPVSPAFVLACAIVGVVVLGVAVWFAMGVGISNPYHEADQSARGTDFKSVPRSEADHFLRGCFAVLITLFLLGPTANPWYLLWAIPFLPWVRLWSWFLLPGIVIQYYLRFWFEYHWPSSQSVQGQWLVFPPVPGTSFSGNEFFDSVWLWAEYLPFYLVLCGELWSRHLSRRDGPAQRSTGGVES